MTPLSYERAVIRFAGHPQREAILDRIYDLLQLPPPFREGFGAKPIKGDGVAEAVRSFFTSLSGHRRA